MVICCQKVRLVFDITSCVDASSSNCSIAFRTPRVLGLCIFHAELLLVPVFVQAVSVVALVERTVQLSANRILSVHMTTRKLLVMSHAT